MDDGFRSGLNFSTSATCTQGGRAGREWREGREGAKGSRRETTLAYAAAAKPPRPGGLATWEEALGAPV